MIIGKKYFEAFNNIVEILNDLNRKIFCSFILYNISILQNGLFWSFNKIWNLWKNVVSRQYYRLFRRKRIWWGFFEGRMKFDSSIKTDLLKSIIYRIITFKLFYYYFYNNWQKNRLEKRIWIFSLNEIELSISWKKKISYNNICRNYN